MEMTNGTRVSCEGMCFVIGFFDQIWMLVDHYEAGQEIIPIDANANMKFVLHPSVNIKSTSYSTSWENDGRILLNGRRKVLKVYIVDIGDMMIFVLHHGHAGNFLFLSFIAAKPDDQFDG